MNPFIAPANVLGALSCEVRSDELLRPGIHLRVFAGMNASFPVTPFVVFKARGVPGERVAPVRPMTSPQRGFVSALHCPGDKMPVRLAFRPVEGAIDRLSMLDGYGREFATRSKGPWLYSLPDWHSIRLEGSASSASADALFAPDINLRQRAIGDAIAAMALAVQKKQPAGYAWYVGAEPLEDKEQRVARAAPVAWGPRERAVFASPAPAPGKEHQEELERVLGVLSLQPSLPDAVRQMLESSTTLPWTMEQTVNAGDGQAAAFNPLDFLQLGMADYGCARYFGYANYWSPEELQLREDEMLAIATMVVMDPAGVTESEVGALGQQLQAQSPTVASALEEQILQNLARFGLADQPDVDLARVKELAKSKGLVVAPMLTYTAPVSPYDPPVLPQPQVVRRQWSLPTAAAPSDAYSAIFAFDDVPLSLLALLERQGADGEWRLRSGSEIDDATDPAEVRQHQLKPMLFGQESEPFTRQAELGVKLKTSQPARVLGDQRIPSAKPVSFRASASDCFGRFGRPVEFLCQSPDRPKPPPPVLKYRLVLDPPPAASETTECPGTLELKLQFDASKGNEPANDELGVPALAALPRGAKRIATLKVELGGVEKLFENATDQALPTGVWTVDRNSPKLSIALPNLHPRSVASFVLTGQFVDADGVESELAKVGFEVTDPRAPPPHKTGVGVLWTTRPSPAPEVSIDLVWKASPKSQHLVYITDERAALKNVPDGSRGARGAYLCAHAREHDKSIYQRATREPLVATDAWEIRYTLRVPRSLETVQVLRIVPLGPDGAEPPFETCTTVPIAVPGSRRAPPPVLEGQVDSSGKPKLTIIADGLDLVELRRDEPGIFAAGEPGKEPPMFRVRCSSGPVAHPMYAPIQRGEGATQQDGAMPMILKQAEPQAGTREWFEGSFEGQALPPYVPHVFWAEARMPAERCVPADTEQRVGGVGPVHPEAAMPAVRLWSAASAPLALMHVPAALPDSPKYADITLSRVLQGADAEVTISIADPPRAHPKAIGRYRLAIWSQWEGGPIEAVSIANGAALNEEWPSIEDGKVSFVLAPRSGTDPSVPLTLRLAYIDPLGRMGALTADIAVT